MRIARKLSVVLGLVLMCLSVNAQYPMGHEHGSRGGRGRHYIECATSEHMTMTLKVLEDMSFEDKKLEVAELSVTLGHFCVDDLARIAGVFSFDENRTKFLIYAYDYCQDPQNYYVLRDVFKLESNFEKMMDTVMPKSSSRRR